MAPDLVGKVTFTVKTENEHGVPYLGGAMVRAEDTEAYVEQFIDITALHDPKHWAAVKEQLAQEIVRFKKRHLHQRAASE